MDFGQRPFVPNPDGSPIVHDVLLEALLLFHERL